MNSSRINDDVPYNDYDEYDNNNDDGNDYDNDDNVTAMVSRIIMIIIMTCFLATITLFMPIILCCNFIFPSLMILIDR